MNHESIQHYINEILKTCTFEHDEDDGFTFGNYWRGNVSSLPMGDLKIAEIFADFGHSLQEEVIRVALENMTKAQKRELLLAAETSPQPGRLCLYLQIGIHPKVLKGLKEAACVETGQREALGWMLSHWGGLLARELLNRKQQKAA